MPIRPFVVPVVVFSHLIWFSSNAVSTVAKYSQGIRSFPYKGFKGCVPCSYSLVNCNAYICTVKESSELSIKLASIMFFFQWKIQIHVLRSHQIRIEAFLARLHLLYQMRNLHTNSYMYVVQVFCDMDNETAYDHWFSDWNFLISSAM